MFVHKNYFINLHINYMQTKLSIFINYIFYFEIAKAFIDLNRANIKLSY